MSYDDYRSGHPSAPPRATRTSSSNASRANLSAYDSFAASLATNGAPNPPRTPSNPISSDTRPPTMPSSRPPLTTTGPGRIDNPYSTNAYASARPGAQNRFGDVGGSLSGGPAGADFYATSKPKGNIQGKLKDTIKNTMAQAKQDNWKVVCVKATSHEVAPPKGKHVRVIMQGLQWGGSISNRESPAGGIFYHLRKRMMSNQWIVVVKAMTIFHHIFRDGNEKFVEFIASNSRSIFKMDFFADSTPEGFAYSPFIKTYGAYIEQWLAMKAAVKFPPGKSKEDDPSITRCYRDASIEDILAALPVIMDSLDCLLELDLAGQVKYSPVATPALSMILRDLTIFWVTLSEGMIRLLDMFFNLEKSEAVISLDVYKRFVDTVGRAQPFFDAAKSLNTRWQTPEMGAISLELMDSMQQYIDQGPDNSTNREPQFSDEEEYDEPVREPEPVPEDYYEPEPEYYSEEEVIAPAPRFRPPTPSVSSSEEEEEEESSSEEEDETDILPSAPEPVQAPKAFDPLHDLLGIDSGTGESQKSAVPQQNMALQVYGAAGPAMFQPATLEHTVEDRVANVKGIMAANTGNQQRAGFGVNGTNMQMAMYGGPQQQTQVQQQQAQQQMYNTMSMQQQQQMAAYQTMAAYQSMAQNQQLVMYQMQQQSMANGMRPMNGMQGMNGGGGMQRMGMMGNYTPVPQGNQTVPVMQAERTSTSQANYRVQKGTKPTRVNEDDVAFGPLLDQMKKSNLGK